MRYSLHLVDEYEAEVCIVASLKVLVEVQQTHYKDVGIIFLHIFLL